jgi:hypothetical protein
VLHAAPRSVAAWSTVVCAIAAAASAAYASHGDGSVEAGIRAAG